jgi:glycosyltransferase involved in cell wall biosynthesis
MRILHTVEFYHPSTGGAQEVVRRVSEGLVARGHEVTVATTDLKERGSSTLNRVEIRGFKVSGNAVRGCAGETERYRDFLLSGRFDVMMNYAAQQWATDLVYPILSQIPYRKTLAPCGFSGLFDPAYRSYFHELPGILKKYDHLIFHSNSGRDVQFVRQHGIDNGSLIPNGASLDEFSAVHPGFRAQYRIPPDQALLLTVGSHTGAKGHRVVMEAFRRARIGPATLIIIGNTLGSPGCLPRCKAQARFVNLATFGKKRVLLLDRPRAEVITAYQAADIFLFGSNIECSPIVLFEAAASGTPFISTACGNAAEIAEWTQSGVIVRTTQDGDGSVRARASSIADAIEDLLGDRSRLEKLRRSGSESWTKSFTWEHIALEYERVYLKLLSS